LGAGFWLGREENEGGRRELSSEHGGRRGELRMAGETAGEVGGAGSLDARVAELERRVSKRRCPVGGGAGIWSLGMAIAVVLSWARNASILWAILHGFFSWGYVIYWAVTRK